MTARERLAGLLAPAALDALEQLVSEAVADAVADTSGGGGSPWLTLAEAADYLRVSPRTLERLLARGRLHSTVIGRRRLLHRDDLDGLARAATGEGVASTTPPRRRTGVR